VEADHSTSHLHAAIVGSSISECNSPPLPCSLAWNQTSLSCPFFIPIWTIFLSSSNLDCITGIPIYWTISKKLLSFWRV